MPKCIICEKETKGSIGAAGYVWRNICQSCKDKADQELLDSVGYQTRVVDAIFQNQ